MGITEETKQTRQKAPGRRGQSSVDSSVPGIVEPDENVEAQDKVDQVREILFGAQRAEYDRKFNRLEEILNKNISDVNNDTAKKLGMLSNEYDKRFARIEELLVKNISDLKNDTTKRIGVLSNEYDERLAHIEELLVKNISDLKNDTTKRIGVLSNEYDKRLAHIEELLVKNISEVNNALSNKIQELHQEKVGKAAFSKLLEKILKVSRDLNIAKPEDSSGG